MESARNSGARTASPNCLDATRGPPEQRDADSGSPLFDHAPKHFGIDRAFVIAPWALRPADRRLSNARLAPETTPLAWAVPIGILLLLYVVSYLTLPAVNTAMHKRARDLGWIAR
jgi:hypothetical protein